MKKIYILFVGLLFTAIQGFAQQGALLYTMEKIPQVNRVNPSFFPENKGWVEIFSFSPTIYSPISFSDVITTNSAGKKAFVGTDEFLNTLNNSNRLQLSFDASFLSFGIRASDWLFTFSNTTHVNANVALEKDMFGLVLQGNGAYEGETATLIGEDFGEALIYQEIALGVGRKLSEQWTVGAKAKLLIGAFHVTTGGSTLSLETADGFKNLTARSNIDGRMSSIVQFDSTDFSGGEYQSPKNLGLGFDLGATYKLNDKFEFSASLLDMGFISWSQNVKRIRNHGTGTLSLTGQELDSLIYKKEISIALQDSLDKAFDIQLDNDGSSYSTALPFKFFLSGSYRILPTLKFSAMYRGEVFNSNYYSSTTLDLNYTLGNWFEVSVGNSFVSSSFFNPGIGLNFTILNTWQIFLAANYMSNIYAVDIRTFSGMFGMNLTFGKSGNSKKNFSKEEGIRL